MGASAPVTHPMVRFWRREPMSVEAGTYPEVRFGFLIRWSVRP
jgi:hypothetical protein